MGTCSSDSASIVRERQIGDIVLLSLTAIATLDELVTIKYSEIPSYLHSSAIYLALSAEDDNEEISVPVKCFRDNPAISDVTDFAAMLEVMLFWGLDTIPESMLEFCAKTENYSWVSLSSVLPDRGMIHRKLIEYSDRRRLIPVSTSEHEVNAWTEANPPESENGSCAAQNAVRAGELELLICLCECGYRPSEVTCVAAALNGNIQCLKYLVESGCPVSNDACNAAAEKVNLNCLQYQREVAGCKWNKKTICETAARGGYLNCLQYAHTHGAWLNIVTTNLLCLRYTLEHNCLIHRDACYFAVVSYPSLERLQLLREFGASWDDRVSTRTIQRELSYLKYAIENACPYKESILIAIAIRNKAKHMRYLVEEVLLPVDERVFSAALVCGSVECVEYLVTVGCPCNFVLVSMSVVLCDADIVRCIQYACEHGWPCSKELNHFVFANRLPLCREYMRSEGFMSSTS